MDGTILASNEEAAAAVPNLAPAPAHPPPVYPTRIPPTTTLSYELKRGFLSGSGELRWSNLGQRYQLSLEGRLPIIGTLLTQRSSGGFDNAGLAPERFTEKRRGRSEQAANLQRSAGIVSFSGPSNEYPLLAGTQDRLSWMVQMAAIAEAWKHVPPAGERLYCFIVGARGDGDVWVFSVEGQQVITTALGELRAVKLMRVPREPHDTKVEVWLDPSRHHLPALVRLTENSGDPLELSLQATSPTP